MQHHPLIEARKTDIAALVDHFKKDIATLRTGRATPTLVEHVLVEAYGVKTPLAQLASLSVPDPKTLIIQPWDTNILKDIERSITASNIGLAPIVDGTRVRLTLPPMTEETRKQLVKLLKEKLEASRQSLRRLRDTIRETIMSKEKDGELPEDERYRTQKELDDYTHTVQEQLCALAESKEKEVTTL